MLLTLVLWRSTGAFRSMGLLGVTRANTAVGVGPKTFLLLLLLLQTLMLAIGCFHVRVCDLHSHRVASSPFGSRA
jgi:hypothetical protein